MKKKLLIVEDEALFADQMIELLEQKIDCRCWLALNMQLAQNLLQEHSFDLVILDRHLPDGDGLSLFKWLREEQKKTKVLILSGLASEEKRVEGLLAGAFDYLTKPFLPVELVEKVKRFSQVMEVTDADVIQLSQECAFMPQMHRLMVGEREEKLTDSESQLLLYLWQHRYEVVERSEIRQEIWREGGDISENAINAKMYRIRKKLGACGVVLSMSRSLGYQLKMTSSVTAATTIT